MPYVVQKLESIQYTGSNMEAIQAVVNNADYWQSSTFSVNTSRVKWTGAEGDSLTIPVGGYLVYNVDGGSMFGMSQADYESQYHEIS